MNKKNHGFTSKSRRSYRLYREHTSLIKIELIMITHLMCNIFYVELNENKFFKASTSIFLKKIVSRRKKQKVIFEFNAPAKHTIHGGKKISVAQYENQEATNLTLNARPSNRPITAL